MSVATVQGNLWGAGVQDYAALVEGFQRPVYERVFDEIGIALGTRLLDVACGPGLAIRLAADRGAQPAGLDAAEASIAIARERVPQGDFRVGDMEALPWPDASFDVVTCFNGFQFAVDPLNALRQARRVIKPDGRLAMVVWGRDEDCDIPPLMGALRELLPPQSPGGRTSVPLWTPGRVESLLQEADMAPVTRGEVEWTAAFPDLETAQRGLLSAGAAVAIIQRVGVEPVQRSLAEGLAPFRTHAGEYHLRNRFLYVIASR
jgi:ubiquinone/menaquinone biosynthesis C-methylase UbiE